MAAAQRSVFPIPALKDWILQNGLGTPLLMDVLDQARPGTELRRRVEELLLDFRVPGFRPGRVGVEALGTELRRLKQRHGNWVGLNSEPWLRLWAELHLERMGHARARLEETGGPDGDRPADMQAWVQASAGTDGTGRGLDPEIRTRLALAAAVVGDPRRTFHADEEEMSWPPLMGEFLERLDTLEAQDPAWDRLDDFVGAVREAGEAKAARRKCERDTEAIEAQAAQLWEDLHEADRVECLQELEVEIPSGTQGLGSVAKPITWNLVKCLADILRSVDAAAALRMEPGPRGYSAIQERAQRLQDLRKEILARMADLTAFWTGPADAQVPCDPTWEADPPADSIGTTISEEEAEAARTGETPSEEEQEQASPSGEALAPPASTVGPGEHLIPLAPAGAGPGAGQDPAPSPLAPAAAEGTAAQTVTVATLSRIRTLMEAGRLGLAHQYLKLLEACGGSGEDLPPAAVLGVLSLYDRLSSPHGPIAARIEAFFHLYPERCARRSTEILAWVSTLRPALVSPMTGAYARMQNLLTSSAAAHDMFREVTDLLKRFPGGVPLGLLAGVEAGIDYDQHRQHLRQHIEAWGEDLVQRTVLYAPATKILQRWARAGFVSQIIEDIGTDRQDRIREWSEHLADPAWVDRQIREGEESARVPRIVGRAEQRLRGIAQETLDVAVVPWLRLQGAGGGQDGGQRAKVEQFIQHIGALRTRLVQELDNLSAVGDPLLPAALACASQALGGLTSGRAWEAEETPAPLWRDLLLAPMDLDAAFEPWENASSLAALESFLDAGDFRPEAAFEIHVQRRDLARAQAILEQHGLDAAPLRARLAQSAQEILDTLRTQAADQAKAVGLAAANGLIGEEERGQMNNTCFMIQEEASVPRSDEHRYLTFGPMFEQLEGIRRELDRRKEDRKAEALVRLAKLGCHEESPEYLRIFRLIEAGDHLTATEYIQLLQEGDSLPEDLPPRDVFREFYPDLCRELHRLRSEPSFGPAGRVEEAIEQGRSIGVMTFDRLEVPRRKEAVAAFKAWNSLKRRTSGHIRSADHFDLMTTLASFLGFESPSFTEEEAPAATRMQTVMHCKRIEERSICPVEQFGSRARGKYRVLLVWERPQPEQLNQAVGDLSRHTSPTIVFYLGRLSEIDRDRLARQARESNRNFLVLDENLLLFLAAESDYRLPLFFRCTLPFTGINPFVTTSSLVPPEMFYGRRLELQRLLDVTVGDCFVYGGRQLGKTALLREAQRRFDDPGRNRHALWIDLRSREVGHAFPAEHIWVVLHRELDLKIRDLFGPVRRNLKQPAEICLEALREWFRANPDGRMLLLLDEADQFMKGDGRNGFAECAKLKNLMEETQRHFKVVFAGLHNVQRTTVLSNNPLVHLGQAIEIGPLQGKEYREADRLVREPLEAVGFRFENPDLVGRILARTNFYPSLIQIYCDKLLAKIGSPQTRPANFRDLPPFLVREKNVEEVQNDPGHRQIIIERFRITLDLDLRYGFLANLVAFHALRGEHLRLQELYREAIDWWPAAFGRSSELQFEVLLDEMICLGVLRHDGKDAPYLLRNSNTMLLLGTPGDIERALVGYGDRPLEAEFDPAIYRRKLGSGEPRRSPITFADEGHLLGGKSGVTLITGTEAAGTGDLRQALEAIDLRDIAVRTCSEASSAREFKAWLDRTLDKEKEGFVLLLVPAERPWAECWIDEATVKLKRLRKESRMARIVFVADPAKAWTLTPQWEGLQASLRDFGFQHVELRPWAPPFVRQWIADEALPNGEATAAALARITGHWPALLYREAARLGSPGATAIAELHDPFGLEGSQGGHLLGVLHDSGSTTADGVWVTAEDPDVISGLDETVDSDELRTCLAWAERLGLLLPVDARTWRFDPAVESMLRLKSHA